MRHYRFWALPPVLLSVLWICSCHSATTYEKELAMTDSAYMQGKYHLGKALMEINSKNAKMFSDAERHYFQLLKLEQLFLGNELTVEHLGIADTLFSYYLQVWDEYKLAKTILFKGWVDLKEHNYAKAHERFLQVRNYAEVHSDARLLGLTEKCIDDLYFSLQINRDQTQYGIREILKKHDELDRQNREREENQIWLLVMVLLVLIIVLGTESHAHWLQKETASIKLRMMEKEKEENEASLKRQIEENNRKLATLREEQAKAQLLGDEQSRALFELEAIALENKNRSIEAMQQRKEALLHELYDWDVYKRLKSSDPQTNKRMDEADWMHLGQRLDNIYDQFTKRLLSHASLSETELRICYLLKINVPLVDIADILYKSKSAITMARKRMYQKFYGKSGSAEELDELIAQM